MIRLLPALAKRPPRIPQVSMSYAAASGVVSHGRDTGLGMHAVIQRKMANGKRKPLLGAWQMIPGHIVSRALATCGFDWVLVDCEHGAIDDAGMHEAVSTIAANGVSPWVRIPAPEGWMCKRALDAGAHAVMAPLINNREEVEKLVSYCKFPVPTEVQKSNSKLIKGIRGAGSPYAPTVFGQSFPDYVATANQNTMVIVQIETREGLKNVADIASVPGLDALLVGPNDLCSFMGFEAANHANVPEVQEAIATILKACKDAGKLAGIYCIDAAEATKRFEQGFDFMNIGNDAATLMSWSRGEIAKMGHL